MPSCDQAGGVKADGLQQRGHFGREQIELLSCKPPFAQQQFRIGKIGGGRFKLQQRHGIAQFSRGTKSFDQTQLGDFARRWRGRWRRVLRHCYDFNHRNGFRLWRIGDDLNALHAARSDDGLDQWMLDRAGFADTEPVRLYRGNISCHTISKRWPEARPPRGPD
jgi:hypothetical protein